MQVIFKYQEMSSNSLPYDVTYIWSMSPKEIRTLNYRSLYQRSRQKLENIICDIAGWQGDLRTNEAIRIRINYGCDPVEMNLHYKQVQEPVIVDKADFVRVFEAILRGFQSIRREINFKKGVI